jgi:hypothetical protein
MQELLSRRGESLLQLARMYLPEMSRAAIDHTFESIRGELRGILARRDARQAELKDQSAQIEQETAGKTHELEAVTDRLNEKVAQREKLEAQVADTLKRNSEFQERSKLAMQAEESLHKNEQRVGDIQNESAKKLPAYEKSRLFLYLYERQFGSPAYKAGEWTRWIDGWVAKLIGYNNAKIGYEYLKKTPTLVAEEVGRRRDQFNALMQQVEAIQRTEADKAGLTQVLSEGDALGKERDRLVQVVEQAHQKAEGVQQELASLSATQNQFYTEAIERFRRFLGDTKLAILQKRATETPEPQDDRIIADLVMLDREIEEIHPRVAELEDQRKASERVQQGLDTIVRRYRQANFDSQRSFFPGGFDARRLADRFRDGFIDADGLWKEIESAQQFRPHWVDSTFASGTQVFTSPTGRVLMGAIVNAANAALQESASRGVRRREADVFNTFPSFPSPSSSSSSSPSPPSISWSGGESDGFTTIDGF